MPLKIITTVVTPAESYDLTTLEVVKQELDVTDGARDELLKRYIGSASGAAAQYCNRKFQQETIRDEVWPEQDPHPWVLNGSFDVLQLSRWPVVSVSSVTENGTALVEGTDFRVDAAAGRLLRLDAAGNAARWNAWPKVVEYVTGFAEIPGEVEDAVIRLVSSRWAAKGRDRLLRQEDIPGVISRTWWVATSGESGNMPPDVTDLLDNYRVSVIA
ncbi:head-tail connector protein [Bradyrhizobium sp. HKCCYLRH3099]|uniref:head-tail connector protein n=1 Tax=unclassified Bradyrhizobium TaxID=2631580 RepID=UPI003EB7A361